MCVLNLSANLSLLHMASSWIYLIAIFFLILVVILYVLIVESNLLFKILLIGKYLQWAS